MERHTGLGEEEEREKMRVMDQWLEAVCAELGLEPSLVARVRDEVLAMVSDIAHGPSRPGAPMTALVLGLVSHPLDEPAIIGARAERLSELARDWRPPAP